MISVVVPIFNEQENLPELRRRLTGRAGSDRRAVGDRDGERRQPRPLARDDPRVPQPTIPRVKLVDLSRNFGHQPPSPPASTTRAATA
jgi:dolichol-phosphate mannosyltransferase